VARRSIRTATDFSCGCNADPTGCCDAKALPESFLSHLQARNKDSKPRPKTNQYCAEFTGSIDRKRCQDNQFHWRQQNPGKNQAPAGGKPDNALTPTKFKDF
jgi:hypothetical protein